MAPSAVAVLASTTLVSLFIGSVLGCDHVVTKYKVEDGIITVVCIKGPKGMCYGIAR